MRLLVVNGDDLGLSGGVNDGIFEAHTSGILTSASLMVLEPAAEDAAERARQYPELSIGLHFVEDGSANLDDPRAATSAFHVQLDRFRELMGRDPTHFDAHHHVHSEDERRLRTFCELVEPLGIPVRNDGRVAYIGGFWGQWEPGVTQLDYVRRPFLLHLVQTEVLDGFTELACHPARIIGDFTSSYLDERAVELATLTETGLSEEIEAMGVKLVSYHDWPSGEAG
jgi:predicted glycoside hydrolase/deacetylase ChbG (UPF0249 family)